MGFLKKSNAQSKASVAALRSKEDLKSKAASKAAIETSDDPATSASEAFNEDDSSSTYRVQNLSPEDLENFEVVKRGDLEGVKELLESGDFQNNGDINRMDLCGFTMLHHAVVNQYEKVVELLLQQDGILVYDTLYYAILEDNVDIVKQLIVHTSDRPESVNDAPDRDSDFSDSLTPFMLACKKGNKELIQLFYNDGERLTWCPENEHSMYHDRCACNMCNDTKGLEEDRNRLTLWQAFSNPVYISFMTNQIKGFDPVQEAFYLIGILREEVIPKEVIFTQEYTDLKENLEAYTVDLLDMCRSRYETELMLKAEKDNKETTEPFPRLQWAMRLRHSNFVTHQHAQSMIYKWWVADGWPSWPGLHPVAKALHFLSRLILFIPVSILLLFDRESSLGRFFSTPLNIFLNSMAAYIVFLIVLMVQVLSNQRCNTEDNLKPEDECTEKGPPHVGTELVIVVFVLGFILSSLKHFWWSKHGFFRQKWNIFNVLMQLLFLLTFVFWGISYLEWMVVLDQSNGVIPNVARHTWEAMDPVLISEALFGMATILSFARLMQYFQVESKYGPLQTGMGSMIHRALSTGLVFAYILVAFAAGISGNYKGYLVEENDAIEVQEGYSNFWTASHRLFYGFYAVYTTDSLDIAISTKDEEGNVAEEQNEHYANEFVGRSMIAIFHIATYIVMFNMLIAFFCTAFGDIQDNMVQTWKYIRTEAFLFYGAETAIPSPFNLLMFLNFYYYSKCSKKSTTQAACNMNFCCHYKLRESKEEARTRKIQYLQLMKKFTMQYLDLVNERGSDALAEADDIKEIIEELDELKSLMKEQGLTTPPEEPIDETINEKFEAFQKSMAKQKSIKHKVIPQFGTTLKAIKALNDGDVIPPILKQCIEFLDQPKGLELKGIFRIDASKPEVTAAISKANEGEPVKFDDNYFMAAQLIKKFLGALKEPLLTFQSIEDIKNLSQPDGSLDKKAIVKRIVGNLPAENLVMLKYIVNFLGKVIGQSAVNEMGAKNLAIVFGPNIIRPSDEGGMADILMVTAGGSVFTEILLENKAEILDDLLTLNVPGSNRSFASRPESSRTQSGIVRPPASGVQISSPPKSAMSVKSTTPQPDAPTTPSVTPVSEPGLNPSSVSPAPPDLPPKTSSQAIPKPQASSASPSASKTSTVLPSSSQGPPLPPK